MAGSQSVGGIHYDVAMDIQQLLTAQRTLDQRLSRMESGFNQTSSAIDGTNRAMSSLSKVAAALTSYLSVQAVAGYADAWTVLNNKLSNSVREGESLINVTERIFNISQETRSSLDATATLYARLERGTRQYNTSAEDLARLTTIINQGFIVSGATAQEAENAIIQLSQGIASGVLRGEEFNSVSEQGSRLMVALADSLGVGIGELRKMAAEGKLTTDVVVNGLLSQGNSIGKEFANTTQTMSQALQAAGNNITKFFGESSTVQSFVSVFNDSVVAISSNLESLSTILTAVALVMGGRYVGALTMATMAKVQSAKATISEMIATRQAASAEVQANTVKVRRAMADRDAALSALNLAKAEYQVAKGSAAEATALANVIRLKTAYSESAIIAANANNVLLASQARLATMGLTLANVWKGLKMVLAPLGGIVGAATLAAGAIFYFYQKSQEAKQEALAFADSIEELKNKMKDMSDVALMGNIAEASKSIDAQKESIQDLKDELEILQDNYSYTARNTAEYQGRSKNLEKIQRDIAIKTKELEEAQDKLARTTKYVSDATQELKDRNKDLYDAMNSASGMAGKMGAAIGALQQRIKAAADEKARLNNEMRDNPETDDGKKAILNLKEQNELLGIKDKRQRAIRKAEMEAAKLTQNADQAKDIVALATANYDLTEAERESSKAAKASTKTTDEAGEALKRLQAELTRLNQGYAEGSLELAQYDAAQALGAKASPEQIALAKERAKSIWEVQAATKAATKAEEDRKNSQANFTSLQESVSPVTAIDNQFAKQMEQINQYKQLYPQSIAEAEALRSQIEEQYRQKRMDAQWQELSNASLGYNMLTSAVDSFGGNASNVITGLVTGTMSAADAARSLGNTMLNSVVNSLVQVGVEMLKNFIIGQTMGSAAAAASAGQAALVATAWAPAAALSSLATLGANAVAANSAIVGTVGVAKGMAVAGARYSGGPVDANKMYQVGEHGKPEIFKASTGKQYMIPGDNGRVISNKDMQGGGAPTVIINLTNNTSAQPEFGQPRYDQNSNTLTIDGLINDFRNGGPASQTFSQYHNAPRKAVGSL
ncbi:TPA: tape measure protein [Providencia rettgeri]|nr:tape measure protein [Providencia rettgeri]